MVCGAGSLKVKASGEEVENVLTFSPLWLMAYLSLQWFDKLTMTRVVNNYKIDNGGCEIYRHLPTFFFND
jgi:hypothetical protein